ncbi:MAG: T9SS type A sorting domain-containing protein [Bacteroidales bacterium]
MKKNLLALFLLLCVSVFAQNSGFVKEMVPDLSIGRLDVKGALLPDSSFIVFGGHTPGFIISNTAERWKEGQAAWAVKTMTDFRDCSAIVRLDDNRIMLAGGMSSNLGVGQLVSTELFDATTNTFTSKANMNIARTLFRGALLANGKALFVGNWYNDASLAEVYNPQTNEFSLTNPVVTQRSCSYVIPRSNNGAIIMGGFTPYGGNIESIELYDYASNSFSAFRNTLFENESGWIYNTYAPSGTFMPEDHTLDGKFYMSAYKDNGNQGTQYMVFSIDPDSILIRPIITNTRLLTYNVNANDSINFALSSNFFMDKKLKKIYFWGNNVNKNSNGNFGMALYSYDIKTKEIIEPTAFENFSYFAASGGGCILPNGKLLAAGGNYTSNFDAHPHCFIANPTNSINAIQEVKINDNGLNIFSNTRQNVLNISYSGTTSGIYTLKIYNTDGRCVRNQKINLYEGINNISIDASNLARGIFLVQLSGQNTTATKKFIR